MMTFHDEHARRGSMRASRLDWRRGAVLAALVTAVAAVGCEDAENPARSASATEVHAAQVGGADETEILNVHVSNNLKRRFGAPHVAVNPKNPDNIVVIASASVGYTRECVAQRPAGDCEMVNATLGGLPLLPQPRGVFRTPEFTDVGVFVSFDAGKTFKTVDISQMHPPGHPEIKSKGEGPVTVTADGTFYIGFNAINWGTPQNFFPNGGVGVIKSTDGGLTWSWGNLTQTPADWPYGETDTSTGTFYMVSGIGFSTLGSRANGVAGTKEGPIGDRWIASTQDGVTWTKPQPLGGDDGARHVSGSHSGVTAANGIIATMFQTDRRGCQFFVGGGSTGANNCLVFQTSTDAGATWSRHRVPLPADFTPAPITGLMFAANPAVKENFTVVLLRQNAAEFWIYQTRDAGKTFTGPTKVSEDTSKTHFAPWVTYSPRGELGLMWRTYERDPAKPGARPPFQPYSVWAALSTDGGATFSKPLKVSKANSPAPPDDPKDAWSFIGDHGPSGMTLDAHGHAYVVWADWTPGERSIYLGRLNVTSFAR